VNDTSLKIEWHYPIFPDNTTPNGMLPRDKGAQACWYYYILCQKQKELVGRGPEDQVIVVDTGYDHQTPWHDHHYLDTGRSLEQLYQMSLETIFNYWPAVQAEAARLELPAPDPRYMSPRRFMI
jgi:hypothetical protein